MKKLLIISFSDLKRDPRVSKQIDYLGEKFQITTAGYGFAYNAGTEHINLPNSSFIFSEKVKYLFFILFGFYSRAYLTIPKIKNALKIISQDKNQYDFIIANDSLAWPIAFMIRGNARIICDAHEYAPKEFEDNLKWRLFFQKLNYFICETYLPRASKVLTVSDGIALEYERVFKIKKPVVIMNTPPYFDIRPSQVDPNCIKMIHHGGAIRSRKIENMIEMMSYLDDRFSLNLMLLESDAGYLDELKTRALRTGKNINFLATVPMRAIVPYISQFDIGIYILEPTSFNNRFALPNKIFEFIQARLAIAIGPSPEMAKIVNEYDLGIISNDFTPKGLAKCLSMLDREELIRLKSKSGAAASRLSFEADFEGFFSQI